MIGRLRAVPAVAVALMALAAQGARAANDADPGDCKPGGNQMQMNACAVRDFRASDSKLNIRYRVVMESLSADRRMALRQEQREWLRLRDPRCKTEAKGSEGGSIWPLEFYGCLDKLTTDRIKAINGWEGRQ